MSPYTSHTEAPSSVTPRGRGRTVFKYPTEEHYDCTPIACKLTALSRVRNGRVQKSKAPHPHEKEFQNHIRMGFFDYLQMKYRDEPLGTCLGWIDEPGLKKEGAYYIKDHFSGVVRPRRMKDDMYNNMSVAKLAEHRRRWQIDHGLYTSDETESEEDEDVYPTPVSFEDNQVQVYVDHDAGQDRDDASSVPSEEDPDEPEETNQPDESGDDDPDDRDGSGDQYYSGEDADDEDDGKDYYESDSDDDSDGEETEQEDQEDDEELSDVDDDDDQEN
ncbi:hypothetical protein F5B19DRAFT_312497 [Rostrohypoxylon terebratum]|nr:hypothetical protein F5B19DRAFT_312497 [Rostrohypoxylon terebratum]